jgi:diguanylate cyclase (GGDEF)-like protein
LLFPASGPFGPFLSKIPEIPEKMSTPTAESATVPRIMDAGALRARVDKLNARALELRVTSTREALGVALEACELARAAGYRAGEGYALMNTGACRALLFDLDAALSDLRAALGILDELGDDRGRAAVLVRMGSTFWRRGDYPGALPSLLAAVALHRAAGCVEGEADALNVLGNVRDSIGEYPRALESFRASLALYEALGDRLGMSYVLNNLGNIHGRLGEYEEALEHHRRALTVKRELGDRAGEAIAYCNLGTSYDLLGESGCALEYFSRALELAREIGERKCEANALGSIGEVYSRRGEHALALEHCRASLEVSRAHRLRFNEADALVRLGRTLSAAGRADEAREPLEQSLAMVDEVGSREQACDVHRALSDAWEATGDPAAALRHFKAFHEAREKVWSAESNRRIQSILVQAEVERSEREAALLREKNEELTAANEEKARLLAQLQLQAGELERLTREDVLTGLHNRRHLDHALALEWERARRFGRDLTVAIADLDHFKEVNDRCSHAVGDAVLREVGRILREGTRGVDVVARYGGEEFVLVLVETPEDAARTICERLRAAVEAHDWEAVAPGLGVTVSIGLFGDLAAGSPAALLAAADARLYQAKRAGRNRVEVSRGTAT